MTIPISAFSLTLLLTATMFFHCPTRTAPFVFAFGFTPSYNNYRRGHPHYLTSSPGRFDAAVPSCHHHRHHHHYHHEGLSLFSQFSKQATTHINSVTGTHLKSVKPDLDEMPPSTTSSSLSTAASTPNQNLASATHNDNNNDNNNIFAIRPCYYRRSTDNKKRKRLNLADLTVGQKLYGTKLDQDLLDGKTGPKVFFECGVGRIDPKGKWHIVNGMLRLGKPWTKASVVRKRLARLSKTNEMELFVSKIRLENGQLEVCTSLDEVEKERQRLKSEEKMFSASTLRPGQELIGTVVRVVSYGVVVHVGANRNGLLHIKKVAELYGRFIDKETGLEEAGLEKGARIRVVVESNERKRLFLDFTDDVKAESELEKQQAKKAGFVGQKKDTVKQQQNNATEDDTVTETPAFDISEEEAAAWAAYDSNDYDDYYEDEDEYDEDRDIEDRLGLGSF